MAKKRKKYDSFGIEIEDENNYSKIKKIKMYGIFNKKGERIHPKISFDTKKRLEWYSKINNIGYYEAKVL